MIAPTMCLFLMITFLKYETVPYCYPQKNTFSIDGQQITIFKGYLDRSTSWRSRFITHKDFERYRARSTYSAHKEHALKMCTNSNRALLSFVNDSGCQTTCGTCKALKDALFQIYRTKQKKILQCAHTIP